MRAGLFVVSAAVVVLLALALPPAMPPISTKVYAQQGARGAQPVAQGQRGGRGGGGRGNTPTFPGPPEGMQALPLDMFTSKNFYKDKDLWLDKRYFRCNTPRQITDIWTSGRIKNAQTGAASWGDCSVDYPREQIVSPYPYKTTKEHYEALLAAP